MVDTVQQVLISANRDYIIDLPDSYEILIDLITKKTGIPKEHLNIKYKRNKFIKDDFLKLKNDKLSKLDISVSLNGGFASFGAITKQVLMVGITLILSYLTLASTLSIGIMLHGTPCSSTSEAIFNLPTSGSDNYPAIFFYTSLALFLMVTTVSVTTLLHKESNCDITIPRNKIIATTVTPVALAYLYVLFLSQNKDSKGGGCRLTSTAVNAFMVIGVIFLIATISQYSLMYNTLKKYRTEGSYLSLNGIVVLFLFSFIILRLILLVFGDKTNGLPGIIIYTLSLFFSYVLVIPDFIEIMVSNTSGGSICPERTT